MLTIITSSASFVIGSLAQFQSDKPAVFNTIEVVCVIIFTLEYIFRWATAPSKQISGAETAGRYLRARVTFMTRPMNLVDLVAILPFYIEMLVSL